MDTARAVPVGPIAALLLSVGAVVLLATGDSIGFLSVSAEPIFVLTRLAGWVLLGWSGIIAGACLVSQIRRASTRRTVSRLERALLAAGLLLVAVTLILHPLWGEGGGVGVGA